MEFNHESKQLDIWIDFDVGSTFECPYAIKQVAQSMIQKRKRGDISIFLNTKPICIAEIPE